MCSQAPFVCFFFKKKLVYKCAGPQVPRCTCGEQIATLGMYQSSLPSLCEAGFLEAVVYTRPPESSQEVLGLQTSPAALGFDGFWRSKLWLSHMPKVLSLVPSLRFIPLKHWDPKRASVESLDKDSMISDLPYFQNHRDIQN